MPRSRSARTCSITRLLSKASVGTPWWTQKPRSRTIAGAWWRSGFRMSHQDPLKVPNRCPALAQSLSRGGLGMITRPALSITVIPFYLPSARINGEVICPSHGPSHAPPSMLF